MNENTENTNDAVSTSVEAKNRVRYSSLSFDEIMTHLANGATKGVQLAANNAKDSKACVHTRLVYALRNFELAQLQDEIAKLKVKYDADQAKEKAEAALNAAADIAAARVAAQKASERLAKLEAQIAASPVQAEAADDVDVAVADPEVDTTEEDSINAD